MALNLFNDSHDKDCLGCFARLRSIAMAFNVLTDSHDKGCLGGFVHFLLIDGGPPDIYDSVFNRDIIQYSGGNSINLGKISI